MLRAENQLLQDDCIDFPLGNIVSVPNSSNAVESDTDSVYEDTLSEDVAEPSDADVDLENGISLRRSRRTRFPVQRLNL